MVNTNTQISIIYMGTPDFAVAPLKRLADNGYNVVAVVTAPDKPAGRGQKMQKSAVKIYAESLNLPVLQPNKLRDEDFILKLKSYNPQLFIVVAFRMLPEIVWKIPKLGTFNLHASLLPQYRGAAPINWAIINGEKETGVTTFFINGEIDGGKILLSQKIDIDKADTAETLHDKLMDIGATLVEKTIDKIAQGDFEPIPQNISEKTVPAPKIFKENCKINWNDKAEKIYDFVRGLSPYPAAWTCFENKNNELISAKIYKVKYEICHSNKKCGNVETDGKTYMKVTCANGFIYIEDVQIAGKKRMTVHDFLVGFRNFENLSFN